MDKLRIVFMGTPDFSVPSLEKLAQAGYDIAAVYSQPDKQRGRGKKVTFSPVKEKALELGIPVFQPDSMRSDDVIEQLHSLAPDVIIVIAYGKILPKAVLDIPKYGCLNVHGSLLPKNPALADFLIRTAVERRYGSFDPVAAGQTQAQRAELDSINTIAGNARRVAMSRPR